MTAAHRSRLCRIRGLARPDAGRGGTRSSTSSTARSSPRKHWLRYGVTAPAQAQQRGSASLQACARRVASDRGARPGNVEHRRRARRSKSGALVIEAEGHRQEPTTTRPIVEDFSIRILRGDRLGIVGANGARQDDADQSADRRARARHRHGAARRQSRHGDARPASRQPRSADDADGRADRRRQRYCRGQRRAASMSSAI